MRSKLKLSRSLEFISAFFRAQQVINTSPDRVDKAMLSEKNVFCKYQCGHAYSGLYKKKKMKDFKN